ncbi:MAG: tRNA pseudouridine(38-40) synthase TruA [Armatimonadetes bacterium]|nr:tRNA pseudouridine(38-40) synthase TruA [Armatimonadota bacterium]
MIRAVVAYDGTEFCGFQRQLGDRTVQGELEAALARLTGEPVAVRGAGRTDAGVHARGQVIAFRGGSIPPERVGVAVNRWLPGDVAVRRCEPAPETFDPRRDATARVYSYTLVLDREREPLRDRFATRVEPRLDLAAMQAAAAGLVGEHDFAQFACQGGQTGSTRRSLRRAQWTVEGELVRLWFEADSFLYHQVRLMMGALLEIGRGKFETGLVADMLAGRPRPPEVAVVPPTGLVLEEVRYDRQEELA